MKKLLPTLITIFFSSASYAESGKCFPDFPPKNDWLGGDAAYSLRLSDGRDLWLFGDTFIGKNLESRAGSTMPANTIGISECPTGKFKIEYFWNKSGSNPEPFLKTSADVFKDWPLHAFEHDG